MEKSKLLNRLSFLRKLKYLKKVYPGYAEAYRASDPKAYEADELIEVVFQKTLALKQNLEKSPHEIPPHLTHSLSGFIPCLQKEHFLLQTIEQNYQIIAKFEDESGMYPVWGYSIVGYALLCALKPNAY